MSQTAIPYVFMRGGSSRGPYFNAKDLPKDRDTLANVLVSLLGSGHQLNIDGIGGGNAVTTKVAMLSKSDDPWADVDYFFAQVSVLDGLVDFKPSCGNILAGVASAAIEMGLITPTEGETVVNIRAVNTESKTKAVVQTPSGQISYDGLAQIDGVPGTAAPVALNFLEVAGSLTNKFLPTGNLIDVIDGTEVTCMDVAMPMVIARAADFGLTAKETVAELDENKAFFARMEAIRLKAGELMGMGDCTKSVTPKFGLLAPSDAPNTVRTRYFMPWNTHPTMAVTGSQCLASCALATGTIADGMMEVQGEPPITIQLEHPMGSMDVIVDFTEGQGGFQHQSTGIIRTCRKLADGHVFVPKDVWDGQ
ncbi:MAG: 4-oxalomesaconate tautomerase [Cognatishimia sp.]|uniref:4-oxalomesaconate tautomerase n=1 Tax=Cognatishimia sp. TaxID=2211648 RepID=UPI004058DD5E